MSLAGNTVNAGEVAGGRLHAVTRVDTGLSRLAVIDLANPDTPHWHSTLASAYGVYGVDAVGDVAWVTQSDYDEPSALRAYDVSDPAAPVEISRRSGSEGKVKVMGTTAYVGSSSGLVFYDVSDPAAMTWLGFLGGGKRTMDFEIVGSLAYIGQTSFSPTTGQFVIADISDPGAASTLSVTPIAGRVDDVAIEGDTLYVASVVGLQIYDVSNPVSPTLLGSFPGSYYSVVVEGNVAYVGGSASGVLVLDVSTPVTPVQLGALPTSGHSTVFEVFGALVYASDSLRVFVIDFAGPGCPRRNGGCQR